MWKKHLFALSLLATLFVAPTISAQVISFENPIDADNFGELVNNLATEVRRIALYLAVIAIVFTGFKFITGAVSGDTKKISDAKKIFFYVLIGTAIIVGASVLAQAVVNFAKNL